MTLEALERRRISARRYRARNREIVNAKARQRRAANVQKFQDATRKWQRENPEASREASLKWKREHPGSHRPKLLAEYGLTVERFNTMLAKQGGVCAICQKSAGACVDHCHITGKVRGLLCAKCNSAIGFLNDDFATLIRAVDYIRRASLVQN